MDSTQLLLLTGETKAVIMPWMYEQNNGKYSNHYYRNFASISKTETTTTTYDSAEKHEWIFYKQDRRLGGKQLFRDQGDENVKRFSCKLKSLLKN
jgi:hypothetical protein